MKTILDILLHEYMIAQTDHIMEERFKSLKENIDKTLEQLGYRYCHCNQIHLKSDIVHEDETMVFT